MEKPKDSTTQDPASEILEILKEIQQKMKTYLLEEKNSNNNKI